MGMLGPACSRAVEERSDVGIMLGLGAALSWGLADYFVAIATRTVSALRVALRSGGSRRSSSPVRSQPCSYWCTPAGTVDCDCESRRGS
jgi:hypothetical protein